MMILLLTTQSLANFPSRQHSDKRQRLASFLRAKSNESYILSFYVCFPGQG